MTDTFTIIVVPLLTLSQGPTFLAIWVVINMVGLWLVAAAVGLWAQVIDFADQANAGTERDLFPYSPIHLFLLFVCGFLLTASDVPNRVSSEFAFQILGSAFLIVGLAAMSSEIAFH